jgi:uncharacterized protein (DUF608 family)
MHYVVRIMLQDISILSWIIPLLVSRIYDYYLYSGDKTFIQQNYDRMKSLMDYNVGKK